ncbi:ABC transporter ATP-binding protein [Floricoccus penangensis]|uniref:ABC transporter ATP-binding protein n=1 Tax=Floricoccus penangensis TaxID=1859475 RepID=A0A9Q5JI23_9LACT|nr:ABC transporter ATP-binding protein [Floricoccus penangensis]OFI47946.1 ABC transporter ATP-binding protein [Floricoccus penangensis]
MNLEIKNVSKSYRDKLVIDDINLTLEPGLYGLLGANGAGKSTLMKMICNVSRTSKGEITYNENNIVNNKEFLDDLAYLPQDFSYYPEFTVIDFMLYMAALNGMNKKIAKNKTFEVLDKVGLNRNLSKKKIKTLSGGMKRRLGIAQAILDDPKVLIIDEPTVGLDPKERVRFRNMISEIAEDNIVLLSTHIVSDVEYIADEIIILKNGQIKNMGTAQELLSEIEGLVWEVNVSARDVKDYRKEYTVINQRHDTGGVLLRIISETRPAGDAVRADVTLEDLYLRYFQEEV